jgi:uncharacterized pyridoxal phosphate-containing UPF0001 family protein
MSILPGLEYVQICGLMGMASFTDNEQIITSEFKYLYNLFQTNSPFGGLRGPTNSKQQTTNPKLQTLSMGMSADYKTAIECGSNMIRIGSMLFGERNKTSQTK